MGVNVSAYVERLGESGSWELVSDRPVSTRLKYILSDYDGYDSIKWDCLSVGLKSIYAKGSDGNIYASFHVRTIDELESDISRMTRDEFIRINSIVKSLGGNLMFDDCGEEISSWDGNSNRQLTFPVNRELVDDLQTAYSTIRNVGQREAFDLFINEMVKDSKPHRVVFVVS